MAKEKLSDPVCFRPTQEVAALAKEIATREKITIPEAHRKIEQVAVDFIKQCDGAKDAGALFELVLRLKRQLPC